MKPAMRTNINLPDELHERFRDRCQFAGISMATVIRVFIERELDRPTLTAKEKAGPEPKAPVVLVNAERDAEIVRRVAAGEMYRDIAPDYGLSISAISRIVQRSRQSYNQAKQETADNAKAQG